MFEYFVWKFRRRVWYAISYLLLKAFPAPTKETEGIPFVHINAADRTNPTKRLERSVLENPYDTYSRGRLLQEYYQRLDEEETKRTRLKHVEWFINNRPDHPIAGLPFCCIDRHQHEADYIRTKKLWLKQLKRNGRNVDVLANAGEFFAENDKELAERFFLEVLRSEPNDQCRRSRLADLYSRWEGHEQQAQAEREKMHQITYSIPIAISEIEKPKNRHSIKLFNELVIWPSIVFEAGDVELAERLANRLLQSAQRYKHYVSYGAAINTGNTVLGRAALKIGDLDKAMFHLRQSTTGILKAHRLSLDLVKELAYAGGEVNALRDYLDKCEEFGGLHDEWELELRFQIETGSKERVAFSLKSTRFREFVMAHQLRVLESRVPSSRKELLETLIGTTRSTIRNWSNFSESEHKEHDCASQEEVAAALDKQRLHLAKLEAMLLSDRH